MPAETYNAMLQGPQGLDNLLYSADADFSCFADLALTSPVEYYREGQGSLLQCVLTPADPYMPMPNEEIAAKVHEQVRHSEVALVTQLSSNATDLIFLCSTHTALLQVSLSSGLQSRSACMCFVSVKSAMMHICRRAGAAALPISKGHGADMALDCEDRAEPVQ